MQTSQLLKRNFSYYWRTNLAVVLGVATAVAVLSGALLVGDSVRASLRNLVLLRLGNTDYALTSQNFFREQLAADLTGDPQFRAAGLTATCPMIAIAGTVTHEPSKRVGSRILVYGVDERFWQFNGIVGQQRPTDREADLSESVARELGAVAGDPIVLRVEKPSDIPIESLHSRKEELGTTLRLTVQKTLAADALGEFAIQPQQAAVRAVFVPLKLLQRTIARDNQVNLILVSADRRADPTAQTGQTNELAKILKTHAALEDYGIRLRTVGEPAAISLEHESQMIGDGLATIAHDAARSSSLSDHPVFSYLANSIRSGERSIPYSLVTGLDYEAVANAGGPEPATARLPPVDRQGPDSSLSITLNKWAAQELRVHEGDPITLEYYLWQEDGRLETRTTSLRLAAIVPIAGFAADRDLVPAYPGITGSENLSDWDPPFPIDLKQVRQQDEDYWHRYRTTPKAFISLATAQRLWQTRFGKLTSIRFAPGGDDALATFRRELTARLEPAALGLAVLPARAQGLAASRGATDFGEYFLYFSFFLVVSALLLTALFFKLGIEQRLREIGLLQTIGFPAATIRRLFLAEGVLLALLGSVFGLAGALAYGALMMFGLRTWWVAAVGTTMLSLHVSFSSLLLGGLGGVLAAVLCVVWTLRSIGKQSTRSLLTGSLSRTGEIRGSGDTKRRLFSSFPLAVTFSVVGLLLLLLATLRIIGETPGFFGGGLFMLIALLGYQSAWLQSRGHVIAGGGWWPVSRLGFRNATYRPGRSVLCIALMAAAAFIIVAVDSFRHRDSAVQLQRQSGSGGFPLLAESLLPLVYDPNTKEGRESLNLSADNTVSQFSGVSFTRFRVRPGDDASCLNLYQPANPKIIAPTDDFLNSNRFVFQDALAGNEGEKANPWLLLQREFPDGAVPVVADANSLTYVLHLKLGDDFVLHRAAGPVRLRVVGSLRDSILQSELIMAEKNFVKLFPEQEGFRFFLIDTSQPERSAALAGMLEDRLADFGFDVTATAERLGNFHRVENTYLSTFQMLGGLGLLLGTLGMAAVLLRNVLERRRELALLRAVGYNSTHFSLMVISENALLLCCGIVTGSVCALLAIAPVVFSRHAERPGVSLGLLLLAVFLSGLTASIIATWAALRAPLLPALRAE
jgi:ABC-type lipoprotein release transport system permease subunit